VAKSKQAQAEQTARPGTTSQVEYLADKTPYVFAEVDLEPAALREEALELANKTNGIVCLASRNKENNQISLALTVAKGLTDRFQADKILKKILPQIQGRGGGKPHLAQGGGAGSADLKPLFVEAIA
jgi:alanyl-tRNA synthetase